MHNKDTYDFERKNKSSKLEYIEWDDLWYQAADNTKMRRVLCIGDSISRGTRPFLNLILNAKNTVVDGLATSKAVDNEFLIPLIDYAIAQQPSCCNILIGLGAHGFHIPAEQFGKGYSDDVELISNNYPGKKLILSTIIPIRNSDNTCELSPKNDIVCGRNAQIKNIASRYKLPVFDIYEFLIKRRDLAELSQADGVHFTDEGYKLLAKAAAEVIDL